MTDARRPIDRLLEAPLLVRAAALLGALLLPAAGATFLLVAPKLGEAREARARLEAADRELESARALALRFDEERREAPSRARFIARFDAWVPPAERLPEVLAAVTRAAHRSGLRDLGFGRGPAASAAFDAASRAAKGTARAPELRESAIRLEARAELRSAGLFLDALLAAPRLVRADELQIRPLPTERLARIAASERARLQLSLRLTTFAQTQGGS